MRWRDDELVAEAEGVALIARFKIANPDKPLLVFFPGGGHRGRIVYGHAGASEDDFLFPRLEAQGYSTLALSYPDDCPPFTPTPDLGLRDWSRASVRLLERLRGEGRLPAETVAIGWSMGGRVARNFALDCRCAGIRLVGFVGLAATPPLPGMGSQDRRMFELAPSGLWDASGPESPVVAGRDAHMDDVDRRNGRVVIPREIYRRDYLCNTPLNLRGEALRYRDGGRVFDLAAAVEEQGSFDFASYPLSAVITGGQLDPSHALTSAASWAFLNAQMVYARHVVPRLERGPLSDAAWGALADLLRHLPDRLSRTVAGGHMFFVGACGAEQTAAALIDLVSELRRVEEQVGNILA